MQLSETLPSHNTLAWPQDLHKYSTLSPSKYLEYILKWRRVRKREGEEREKQSVQHNSRVQKMLITCEVIPHASSRLFSALISLSLTLAVVLALTVYIIYIFNQCHSNSTARQVLLPFAFPFPPPPLAFFNCMEFHQMPPNGQLEIICRKTNENSQLISIVF